MRRAPPGTPRAGVGRAASRRRCGTVSASSAREIASPVFKNLEPLESIPQLTVNVRNRLIVAAVLGEGVGLGQGPRSARSQFGSPCRHGAGGDRDEVPRDHQSREVVPPRDHYAISRDLVAISGLHPPITASHRHGAGGAPRAARGTEMRSQPGDAISTPEMRSAPRLARPAADLGSAAGAAASADVLGGGDRLRAVLATRRLAHG